MDLLSQHEAFLRAIFDNPEDDTARLVYADFLQENGEEDRAEFIRVSIELSRQLPTMPAGEESAAWNELNTRHYALLAKLHPVELLRVHAQYDRGIPVPSFSVGLDTRELANPIELRTRLTKEMGPFGTSSVSVKGPRMLTGHPVAELFSLPALALVTDWNLSGEQEYIGGAEYGEYGLRPTAGEYVYRAVVSGLALEYLAYHRAANRIHSLDLRNNNLDNDAAQMLVKSRQLNNLKRLQLFDGNRFRGKVWQQVIARFGEDVVE